MSDQETAIQLIRNEAAELIVRAKAAGVRVRITDTAGVYVVSVVAPAIRQVKINPSLLTGYDGARPRLVKGDFIRHAAFSHGEPK